MPVVEAGGSVDGSVGSDCNEAIILSDKPGSVETFVVFCSSYERVDMVTADAVVCV